MEAVCLGNETTGTTDGAEATEATQEPDSTGATQPTEGAAADEPADEGGGIPTATQPAASGEEDTASGGPAVIFINVIKVFLLDTGDRCSDLPDTFDPGVY